MKHYAFCSFGKDSMATVLLAIQHNDPLDGVVYCETMYDNEREISAEFPEHIEWIRNTAKPRLEQMGVNVIVTRSEWDMLSLFHRRRTRGKYKGMSCGYPMRASCSVESYCKIKQIHKIKESLGDFIEYVGIAADETERLARLTQNKVSLLAKYGVTEAMALKICRDADMLSPTYEYTHRGGCFFCPSATINEFAHFARMRPELFDELLALGDTPNIIGKTVKQGISNDVLRQRVNGCYRYYKVFDISQSTDTWVDVKGTEGRYKVSDKGQFYSVDKKKIVAQTPLPNGKHSIVFTINKKQIRRHAEDVFASHFPRVNHSPFSSVK